MFLHKIVRDSVRCKPIICLSVCHFFFFWHNVFLSEFVSSVYFISLSLSLSPPPILHLYVPSLLFSLMNCLPDSLVPSLISLSPPSTFYLDVNFFFFFIIKYLCFFFVFFASLSPPSPCCFLPTLLISSLSFICFTIFFHLPFLTTRYTTSLLPFF